MTDTVFDCATNIGMKLAAVNVFVALENIKVFTPIRKIFLAMK